MASCTNHPEAAAVAECSACGAVICEECLEPGSSPPLCTTCAISEAGREVASDRAAPLPETTLTRRAGRAFSWLIGILVVLIVAQVAWRLLDRPAPTAATGGPEMASILALDSLMMVHEALVDASSRGGAVPDLIEVVDQVPEDTAAEIRDGTITLTRTESGGFLLQFTLGGGEPPVIMDQEGSVIEEVAAPGGEG